MKNAKVLLKGSLDSPEIRYENCGRLSIKGNSTCITPETSYNQLIDWVGSYKGENLRIDVDINLINCSSVKLLMQTIVAADSNSSVKKKTICWYYSDDDQEELGEMISTMLRYSRFQLTQKD